jgi:hypothetical protein
VQYVQGGYEASFGTHEIDERAHNFTYHVEARMDTGELLGSITRPAHLAHLIGNCHIHW